MFEQTVDYEAAYIARFPCHSDSAGPAFTWAVDRLRTHGGTLAVVSEGGMGNFKDDPLLSRLPASVIKCTPKTIEKARSSSVVVAFMPGAATLEKLDRFAGLKALAVVPWLEPEISAWRRARQATDLLGSGTTAPPTISDPRVLAALASLTIRANLSSGLSHPDDRAAAIHLFRILRKQGVPYDEDEIHAWAMGNGWRADAARELSEYATGVANGKAYRAGKSTWSTHAVNVWMSAASPPPARP